MLILGIDFETTGLDPETRQVVEVGMQLWDWDLGIPVNEMGYLVRHDQYVWDDKFEGKSKVSAAMCDTYGISSLNALKRIQIMMQSTDYMAGQNVNEFDKIFLEAWCKRLGLPNPRPDLLWIDTQTDIEIPEGNSRRLAYMAADHGLCPHNAHRALADVDQTMNILRLHDIQHVLEVAKTPTIEIMALVSYDDREKAKDLHYHAEYENGKFKYWVKTIKEFHLESERIKAGAHFGIKVINAK